MPFHGSACVMDSVAYVRAPRRKAHGRIPLLRRGLRRDVTRVCQRGPLAPLPLKCPRVVADGVRGGAVPTDEFSPRGWFQTTVLHLGLSCEVHDRTL